MDQSSYFDSEFLVSGRSRQFYKFIKKINIAKNKKEENEVVTFHLNTLSQHMANPDITSTTMAEHLIELIHCIMLGYDVDFGIIYAIMTTQSGESLTQRRIGYLTCSLLLNKHHELGIMLINTLQRDLKSTNYLDNCAALNAICYLEELEMIDQLLEPTMKTMDSTRQIVRKKAILALYSFYRRTPSLLNRLEPLFKSALYDKDMSVVFIALGVWKEILENHVEQYEDLLPNFLQIHQQILNRHVQKGYLYHGVIAPWAQLHCLQIYRIYIHHDIGSIKELYDFIVHCLSLLENKVDAAYAIILECVHVLLSIDSLLLTSFIYEEEKEVNPFQVLDTFLKASNHNMKYLGLAYLPQLDYSLWLDDWKNGKFLSEILLTCIQDDVIVEKVLDALTICCSQETSLFYDTSDILIKQLETNQNKCDFRSISMWIIQQLNQYNMEDRNDWWVKTMIKVLATLKKSNEEGDDDILDSHCKSLKQILLNEENYTHLRKTAVDTSYDMLSRTNDHNYSPVLVQFTFWLIGEYAYLSDKLETDIMEQIQNYISYIQDDDYLQICGLQAIKRCIIRSRTWLSGLIYILEDFSKAPIMEKQMISRELLLLVEDTSLEKHTQKSADQYRRKKKEQKVDIYRHKPDQQQQQRQHDIKKLTSNLSSMDLSHASHYQISNTPNMDKKWLERNNKISEYSNETSMMSSLIDMEMNNGIVSPNIHQQHHYHLQQQQQQKRNKKKNKKRKLMTVDEFGNLWLSYTNEGKTILTIPKSIQQEFNINQKNQQMTMINIVNWLKEEWGINIIQIVNEECLANYDSPFYDDDNENHPILIHLQLNHSKIPTYQLHVTLRSLHRHSLKLFSQAYQIELFL